MTEKEERKRKDKGKLNAKSKTNIKSRPNKYKRVRRESIKRMPTRDCGLSEGGGTNMIFEPI